MQKSLNLGGDLTIRVSINPYKKICLGKCVAHRLAVRHFFARVLIYQLIDFGL